MLADFYPFFLMFLLALGLALALLKSAEWVGPSRPRSAKLSPYESGMDPVGSARDRYSVKFYLVAMVFIVFDVEVVFLYPWAVNYRLFLESGQGLAVMSVVSVFLLVVIVGLIYDIKKGGLDWKA